MRYSLLPSRGLVELSGEDTLAFLQGLVSNDVMRLKEGKPVYAALLSPQGKYLHDFFLSPSRGGAVLLDADARGLPDLIQRLKLYRLRSKVAIDVLPDSVCVVALWEGAGAAYPGLYADPRLAALGCRVAGERGKLLAWCAKHHEEAVPEDYDRMRLSLGVPEGARDMVAEKSLLLEFGFEELHGVDFKKGCYIGQEVTARSKYRGQLKKHLYCLEALEGALPEAGTPVTHEGVAVGESRSECGAIGLALLRVAEVEKAGPGAVLQCGEVMVRAGLPVWSAAASALLTEAQ